MRAPPVSGRIVYPRTDPETAQMLMRDRFPDSTAFLFPISDRPRGSPKDGGLIRIALRPDAVTELRHTAPRETDGTAEYVVPGNVLRGSYLAMVSEGEA
jgi:hypothetical protein